MKATLKITKALADPTRFHIYEYVSQVPNGSLVQEISQKFKIHPNVARLHLTKLEQAKLLTSLKYQSPNGGRPSRLYKLAEKPIHLSFPTRNYELLASIAVEALDSLGEVGHEALFAYAYDFGINYVTLYYPQSIESSRPLSIDKKKILFVEAAGSLGFTAAFDEQHEQLVFSVQNSLFKEISFSNDDLPKEFHVSLLQGIVDAIFFDRSLTAVEPIPECTHTYAYTLSSIN
ncbi:helix-turn-helix transcriptional regulator [Priestia koreensis]|uniref:helix-turn-helix transcriptional regulator n=1 Tax=Priestia koreensis TaxID=284581 RepID=UPI00203C6459|nr:helix-turn-helix domain-containing protein [Priestia koreensis]MCM3002464.1 helix-turn-helix domain-containing protein [Priestia koreensis]